MHRVVGSVYSINIPRNIVDMACLIVRIIIACLGLVLRLFGLTKTFSTLFDKILRFLIRIHRNKTVKSMLNQRLIRVYDNDYGTLLHYSAEHGNATIVRELISLGAVVDRRRSDGKTPLMLAAENRQEDCVKVLLEADADVDGIADAQGNTALQTVYAQSTFFGGKVIEPFNDRLRSQTSSLEEFVDKLVEAGGSMYHATFSNDVNVLEIMLRRGFNIDSSSVEGKTAVHAAAELQSTGLMKWLLDNGANVNAINEYGNGPLFYATAVGDMEMVSLLLERGADPNTADRMLGLSPMLVAVFTYSIAKFGGASGKEYLESVEILARYGAVPRDTGRFPLSIFDFTLLSGDFEVTNVLVGHLAVLERLNICDPEALMICKLERNREALEKVKSDYEMCRRMLEVNVCEKMTLFDLLVESDSKMKLLVRKEMFVSKIEEFCSEHKLQESCMYYYNTLTKSIDRGKQLIELENAAISVVCDLFDGGYNQCYVVARKVVDYLDKADLVMLSGK